MKAKIITIGLSPAWDRTIEVRGINWGQHKIISSVKIVPAGKALNINKALAQMGQKSIAAGLWGRDDYCQLKQATADLKKFVQIAFIKAKGKTRENITVIDTAKKRQLHLRSKSSLADEKSLTALGRNLEKIITKTNLCIFSGALPGRKLFKKAAGLIETAKKKGAKVAVDTSGQALKKVIGAGGLFVIKPNIEELGELAGKKIPNEKNAIITAARKLLGKTEFILVSRAQKGAILISRDLVLSARYTGKKCDVYNTVGCGDVLLAAFISEFDKTGNPKKALEKSLKAATAKAFGKLSLC